VIKKPRERGAHSPRWAAEPEKIIIIIIIEKPLKAKQLNMIYRLVATNAASQDGELHETHKYLIHSVRH
jgi:hypothetical protein